MNIFLKKYLIIPEKFINDFNVITKGDYSENHIVIDFDTIANWLGTKKSHLKEVLVKNFEKKYDYTEEQKKYSKCGAKFIQISITPNCFK